MPTEIRMQKLSDTMEVGTLLKWHKKPGDSIRRDENLLDLETDKVVLEVPSPVNGVLGKIVRDSGETVTSGELLGVIEEGAVAEPNEAAESALTEEPSTPVSDTTKPSPSARRLAEEESADMSQVEGTGRGGRITKGDVIKFL